MRSLKLVVLACTLGFATDQALSGDPEVGVLYGFGIDVFRTVPVDDARPEAKDFCPTDLDVEQWARVAKQAGARYELLSAKGPSGFCLWPPIMPGSG